MLKIGKLILGMVQTNCYFLYQEEADEVIVIDPADQGEVIYQKLTEAGFVISAILLTHGHFDHILGVKALKKLANVSVYAYEDEKELCENEEMNVSAEIGRPTRISPDIFFKDGEEHTIAGITFRVIATPGHTKGSCCFYMEEAGFLISGDTLFEEGVGRTDLPTGNMGKLVRSIKDKLAILPENVIVYPGHGAETTIGHEVAYNPYCQ